MAVKPFTLRYPAQRSTSVIFSSPHSGCHYSDEFLAQIVLDQKTIRSSEDAFVDQLFSAAPDFGAPLIAANVPRACVDLNRAVDELDPAVISDVKRKMHNPRISSGLGVIPRVVANGRAIYRGKMSYEQAQARLKSAWHPYHDALEQLISETKNLYNEAIVIDCHSMPHEAIASVTPENMRKPDVVLGDRYGASACHEIVDKIEAAFKDAGLHIKRNIPFAGAYITQAYGRPSRNVHVVQIEIDRSLYMDEKAIEPNENFEAFRDLMTGITADLAAIGRPKEMHSLAAE